MRDFTEDFPMDLTYWSEDNYRDSWTAALHVLDEGRTATTCLISSITDPTNSNFIFCWPLYRDGEDVYVQNSLIFLDELTDEFLPGEPWRSVEPRTTVDEDGNKISEWRTSMDEVRAFLSLPQ